MHVANGFEDPEITSEHWKENKREKKNQGNSSVFFYLTQTGK